MKPNRLILGDGLLGSEIVKQTGWDYASRKKDGIDFTSVTIGDNENFHFVVKANNLKTPLVFWNLSRVLHSS